MLFAISSALASDQPLGRVDAAGASRVNGGFLSPSRGAPGFPGEILLMIGRVAVRACNEVEARSKTEGFSYFR